MKTLALLLSILFALPACPMVNPPLTPGLSVQVQRLNLDILRQDVVIKKFVRNQKEYSVRLLDQYLGVYNDQNHLVLVTRSITSEIIFGTNEMDNDPFPIKKTQYKFELDGDGYRVDLVIYGHVELVVLYDHNGKIMFAMADPGSLNLAPEKPEPIL